MKNRKAFTFTLVHLVVIVVVLGIMGIVFLQRMTKNVDTPGGMMIIEAVREYEAARGRTVNNQALEILGGFGQDGNLLVLVKSFIGESTNYYLLNTKTGEISIASKLTSEEMETMFPSNEQNETDPAPDG